jgi:hypothetical protein
MPFGNILIVSTKNSTDMDCLILSIPVVRPERPIGE